MIPANGILYLCMYLCSNINKISGFRKTDIQINRSCFGMTVISFVPASPDPNPGMSSVEEMTSDLECEQWLNGVKIIC